MRTISKILFFLSLCCFALVANENSGLAFRKGQPAIASVSLGSVFKYNAGYPTKYIVSDTWGPTTASDGNTYVAHDDSKGWQNATPTSNTSFSLLSGFTTSLTGTIVNTMQQFGSFTQTGSDTASWKSMGSISVNGTIYVFQSRNIYSASGDGLHQTAFGQQIIKSSNLGVSFSPLPPCVTPPCSNPYASPMWPGAKFANAFFAQYAGDDYQNNSKDNSNTYVYAVGTDGFWSNGSFLYLGRVLISDIAALDASLWTFWNGSTWGTLAAATPIYSQSNCTSVTGPQYLPYWDQYVMFSWCYPSIPNSGTLVTSVTQWKMLTARNITGPWNVTQTIDWATTGLYNPIVIPKSVSVDNGKTVTLIVSGNYASQDPATGEYTLQLIPATFNYLLERDLRPVNDNSPVFLAKVA